MNAAKTRTRMTGVQALLLVGCFWALICTSPAQNPSPPLPAPVQTPATQPAPAVPASPPLKPPAPTSQPVAVPPAAINPVVPVVPQIKGSPAFEVAIAAAAKG